MQKTPIKPELLFEALYFIGKRARAYHADCVVAIERGGLPLATFLSAYLNVPLERIKVSFYKDTEKQQTPIVDMKNFDSSLYKTPMFVDDLVDTGDTLQYVKETFGNVPYVTLYAGDKVKPDIYYLNKNPDEWIIFPWDTENDGFDIKFAQYGWWRHIAP